MKFTTPKKLLIMSKITTVVLLHVEAGTIQQVYFVRHPDKLTFRQ